MSALPVLQIGEGFAGTGPNAAHVNTMLGRRDGPVGHAWATALATPSAGHAPFVVVLQPNVPVQPPTLFVNKATVAPDDELHASLTWGAAQAGVAAGVVASVRVGVIRDEHAGELVLVVAVWVNPEADNAKAVFGNNEAATLAALTAGRDERPTVREVLEAGPPSNPYFRR
jgi:5,6,7,8-tetrahydromethanopterin hydro-lyase